MRGIHLILLAILLSFDHALSLQCYSCSGIKDSGECQLITCPGVCFMSDMIMTMGNERIKLQSKSCSPSCGLVSELLKQLVDASTLDTGLLPGKLERQEPAWKCAQAPLREAGARPREAILAGSGAPKPSTRGHSRPRVTQTPFSDQGSCLEQAKPTCVFTNKHSLSTCHGPGWFGCWTHRQ
ncbi:Cadherin EGF LAG seven-pass G-type receptor 1 [Manis javanica]|nr:Cadherin EGF LAG seven-pass G-type receptor 1 [Manis javanica]